MSAAQPDTNERVCFVHAGTHKTGTSAIQAFMAANADALGLHYPNAGRPSAALPGHHNFAWELRRTAYFSAAFGTLADLAAELAHVGAPRVCLSSEMFCTLYDRPDALAALRDAIAAAGYRPSILLYVRVQDQYAEAVYAEGAKHTWFIPFARFIEDIVARGAAVVPERTVPFAYTDVIDGFARAFGDDAVAVHGYRNDGDAASLVQDFLDALGVRPAAASGEPPGYINPRSSTGRVITDLYANTAAHVDDAPFADVAAQIISGDPEAAAEPFYPLAANDRVRIVERFAPDNAQLVRRHGVDPATFHPSENVHPESEPARRARELFFRAEAVRATRFAQAL